MLIGTQAKIAEGAGAASVEGYIQKKIDSSYIEFSERL
jgi:hypothetical protein